LSNTLEKFLNARYKSGQIRLGYPAKNTCFQASIARNLEDLIELIYQGIDSSREKTGIKRQPYTDVVFCLNDLSAEVGWIGWSLCLQYHGRRTIKETYAMSVISVRETSWFLALLF
jgi:hypothetical protein